MNGELDKIHDALSNYTSNNSVDKFRQMFEDYCINEGYKEFDKDARNNDNTYFIRDYDGGKVEVYILSEYSIKGDLEPIFTMKVSLHITYRNNAYRAYIHIGNDNKNGIIIGYERGKRYMTVNTFMMPQLIKEHRELFAMMGIEYDTIYQDS